MDKKQRVAAESVDCMLGILNGLLLSLPIWGLIYLCIRFFILS
ncbi:hypothetical protein [Thermoflavimicrobium dichotomicum]|uniref:Uncharacterized protein n=1 Tax=Thermoflavimicrobium dichotomicum TaxID=46223 RepID=A0A1I3K027_9BACL|nr:hypothetical protein [Thermoflavimicrobium dichotomicum]SFI65764.1 hypothetical protein SAMN05421852_101272 [Thermoflavimicrobium dichotomicum]